MPSFSVTETSFGSMQVLISSVGFRNTLRRQYCLGVGFAFVAYKEHFVFLERGTVFDT